MERIVRAAAARDRGSFFLQFSCTALPSPPQRFNLLATRTVLRHHHHQFRASPSEMPSLNARKPFRVVVHLIVDGRDTVTRRFRFATRAEADEAYEGLQLEPGEFAEVVAPLIITEATT